MLASVIIPARNAAATLGRTLAALAAQDLGEPFEVVVVDDGSDDATAAIAEGAGDRVTLVRQPSSGPAAARNAGVAASTGEALAFTDADCFPEPGWLREGLAALEDADLVQGRVVADPEARVGPFDRTVRVGGESGLYETANLFVSRSLFDELGGFENWLRARLGKELAEDLWFGWRARRAGARTAFCAEAVVHHAVFPRGPLGYVAERTRLVYFPHIAAKMPELRQTLFYRRRFLNRRTAAFDIAVSGLLAARWRSSPPLMAASAPYVRIAIENARRGGEKWPAVVAVDLAADLVGMAALAIGSAKARTILL